VKANDKQVGGSHYKNMNGFEHWDWAEEAGLGYLEGCATKYILRHRDKGKPKEDLGKAVHYVEKLLELNAQGKRDPRGSASPRLMAQLWDAYPKAGERERTATRLIAQWTAKEQLQQALEIIKELRDEV
jgi:hypothetical protein